MADYSYDNWGKQYLSDLHRRWNAADNSGNKTESQKVQNEIARITSKYKGDIENDLGGVSGQAIATAKQKFNIAPFKQKMASVISTKDAYGQAANELNPAYQQARTNAGIASQQQQALLRQQLGARGQLSGGLANQGAVNLSGKLLGTLADLDTSYASQKATRAADIQDTDYARKQQDYANALNAYSTTTGLDLQNQQLNYGADQDALTRQYQAARDAITDEQAKREFDESVRQFGLSYTLQKQENDRNYQLSLAQMAQRSSGSSGGGSSGSSSSSSGSSNGSVESQDGYTEITSNLASKTPAEAYEILQGNAEWIISQIGAAKYKSLLTTYKGIVDNLKTRTVPASEKMATLPQGSLPAFSNADAVEYLKWKAGL